jgi:chromosome segregation and condensation protein ScpB
MPTISKLAELPPVTLEEKIEGALFSIGRPIHTTELIESLQEESPLVKRTLRKVARQRKKSSPIVIEEISRDRWVLQLNPIYHVFFHPIISEKFMTPEERRILTEIAYRQPISLAMVKKIVRKIGPVKITEICRNLEERGYLVSEKRARSIVYTSTPKFANDFGFDDESRRLKLQMLWRLKRLMGDYEEEPEEEELEEQLKEAEEEEDEEEEEEGENQIDEEIETAEESKLEELPEEKIEETDIDKEEKESVKEFDKEEENEAEAWTESESV